MPDPSGTPVGGSVAAGFDAVEATFRANHTERGEVGSAVTVLIGGETVVDLWGGWADADRTVAWQADTLVNAYSVGKGIVSLLLLGEVDAGRIGLDDPVASLWPEFAVGGKAAATVRHALSHQAGVPAIHERLTDDDLWDFDRMCDALAATAAWWEPGSRHVYHTNTFGHLVGGLLQRLTGSTPGGVLRDVAGPLDADLWFGVPDDHLHRCAEVLFQSAGTIRVDDLPDDVDDEHRMIVHGYANPPGYSSIGVVNTVEWRQAQVPSTNGHMTARGVARFYEAARTGALVGDELMAEAVRPQVSGPCPVLGQDVTFGLGVQPWTERRPFGRNPGGFGHYGSGGSLGFTDPVGEVSFGYVMNHVVPRWQNDRNRALVDAVYACLD